MFWTESRTGNPINMKFQISEGGFTLIELVIVIGVFGLIGVIILTTLVNILRSTNKTNIINTVRQNGNYALEQMTKTIRTAVSLQTPTLPCNPSSSPTVSSTLSVTASDSTVSSFVCANNTIKLNGNSLLDTNTTYVTNCATAFTCSQDSISAAPVITIDFFVQDNSSGFYEQKVPPIEFQTTIIMQNVGHQ